MTMPTPAGDEPSQPAQSAQPVQPMYVDPITGSPLYVDPTTGQLSYGAAVQPPAPDAPGGQPPFGTTNQMPANPYPPGGYPSAAYPPAAYPPAAYPQPGFAPMTGGYTYPLGANPYGPAARTNGMAIASLVVSLTAIPLLSCYGVGGLVGVVGAILGHVARKQIRERDDNGSGLALAGIICGWIALALGVAIVGIFVYIFTHLNDFSDPTSGY